MRLDAHHRWRRVGRRRRRRNIPTIKRHIEQVVILAPVAEDEVEDSRDLDHIEECNSLGQVGAADACDDQHAQRR